MGLLQAVNTIKRSKDLGGDSAKAVISNLEPKSSVARTRRGKGESSEEI